MVCHDFLFLPMFTEVLLIVDIGVAGHYKKIFKTFFFLFDLLRQSLAAEQSWPVTPV